MPIKTPGGVVYYTSKEAADLLQTTIYALHGKASRLKLGRKGSLVGLKASLSDGLKFFLLEEIDILRQDFRLKDNACLTTLICFRYISCGPICPIEPMESPIYISQKSIGFFTNKDDYFLVFARGDSMRYAPIMDGDLLLIKKTHQFKQHDIVVYRSDNMWSLKSIFVEKESQIATLYALNLEYPDIVVQAHNNIKVHGVLQKNLGQIA